MNMTVVVKDKVDVLYRMNAQGPMKIGIEVNIEE